LNSQQKHKGIQLFISNLEGLEKFVRTEDLNNLERAWPAKRKEIAEVKIRFQFLVFLHL